MQLLKPRTKVVLVLKLVHGFVLKLKLPEIGNGKDRGGALHMMRSFSGAA
jgi:hypothetical protein